MSGKRLPSSGHIARDRHRLKKASKLRLAGGIGDRVTERTTYTSKAQSIVHAIVKAVARTDRYTKLRIDASRVAGTGWGICSAVAPGDASLKTAEQSGWVGLHLCAWYHSLGWVVDHEGHQNTEKEGNEVV